MVASPEKNFGWVNVTRENRFGGYYKLLGCKNIIDLAWNSVFLNENLPKIFWGGPR